MITVHVSMTASGATFSPAKAGVALGMDLASTGNEPGAIGTTGKYKGRPMPWGQTSIRVALPPVGSIDERGSDENGSSADLMPANLDILRRPELVATLRRFGATDIVLWVIVEYRDQCNMEMSPALLAALAGLGVPVAISCYPEDDDEG